MTMTSDQFAALAELISLRAGKSRDAARLVLVDGLTSAEAARQLGLTTQGSNQAVQRCRRALELARAAVA